MKKHVSLILALAIMALVCLLAAVGCSDKNDEMPTSPPKETITGEPTEAPTDEPTEAPTDEPTEAPTDEPTEAPTDEPTEAPTDEPTEAPTDEPTEAPTDEPTEAPTDEPTEAPTDEPTEAPTDEPTEAPTEAPSEQTECELNGHTWADATCTTPKTCSVCGAVEGKALGHDEENHEAQAPSCTETGHEAYVTCKREGCTYTTYEEIEALGHKDDNNDHNCDTCGAVLSECEDTDLDHKCNTCGAPMGVHAPAAEDTHICSYCLQPASEHEGGTATCTEKAICRICGERYGDVLGHDPDTSAWMTDYVGGHYHTCKREGCDGKADLAVHTYVEGVCSICDVKNTFCTEGLDIAYDSSNSTYYVSKYTGSASDVVVPYFFDDGSHGQKPVTIIGKNAFYVSEGSGKSPIGSITLPDSITTILSDAFHGCSELSEITLPSSLKTIGTSSFLDCTGITSITIPSSIGKIGSSAFAGCTSLSTVVLPDGFCNAVGSFLNRTAWYDAQPEGIVYLNGGALTYKGEMPENTTLEIAEGTIGTFIEAFYDMDNITSVIFPDSLTFISDSTFTLSGGIKSVSFGSGLKIIGEDAFSSCQALEAIVIPESVELISSGAFKFCSAVNSITINAAATIKSAAFNRCGTAINEMTVTFCEGITDIPYFTFNGCSSIKTLVLPNSLETIGNQAFERCTSLESITIPSADSIGGNAFAYCTSLTEVILGDGVKTINFRAFADCTSLESITIPSSATLSSFDIFCNCSALTSVTFEHTLDEIRAMGESSGSSNKWSSYGGNTELVISYNGSSFKPHHDAVKATCLADGSIEYWEDIISGGLYADGNYSTLIPDSNEDGEIDILDTVVNGVCVDADKNHSCDVCKAQMGGEHVPEGENTHTCAYCKKPASEHEGGTATCTEKAICRICGESYGDVLGHNIVLDTTKGVDGYTWAEDHSGCVAHGKCDRADCTYTVDANATVTPSKKQTQSCIDAEIYDYTATFAEEWAEDQTVADVETQSAAGHSYGDISYAWNSGKTAFIATRSCSVCAEDMEGHTQTAQSTDHTTYAITTPPTCTEAGVADYYVTFSVDWIDGVQTVSEWYPELGHDWSYQFDINNHWQVCSRCDAEGNATSHAFGDNSTCVCGLINGTAALKYQYDSELGVYYVSGFYPSEDETDIDVVIANYYDNGNNGFHPVTYICSYAIGGNSTNNVKIKSVVIPEGITKIESSAFDGCTNLISVSLPESLEDLGGYAFDGTPWIDAQIKAHPDGDVYIGNILYTYKGTMPADYILNIKEGTKAIAGQAYKQQSNLKAISMPDSLVSIGSNAFYCCTGLQEIVIGENVKRIRTDAFEYCTEIQTVTFNSKLEEIRGGAFYGCKKIESLTIPSSVKIIKDGAFSGMKALTSVVIEGSGLISLESSFKYCDVLSSVTFSISLDRLKEISENVWYSKSPALTVYYNGGSFKVHYDKVDPTCTEDGNVEYWYNFIDGQNYSGGYFYSNEVIDSITIPATHTGGTATCTEKAVCSICGESYGTALGHNFESDVCTRCGIDKPYTRAGNKITFGEYPQTEVTDSSLTAVLNGLVGGSPLKLGRKELDVLRILHIRIC